MYRYRSTDFTLGRMNILSLSIFKLLSNSIGEIKSQVDVKNSIHKAYSGNVTSFAGTTKSDAYPTKHTGKVS